MAPFTQIVFKPLNSGNISNTLQYDYNVQDVYTKTIVDIMKNDYNQIELRIPLPFDENTTSVKKTKRFDSVKRNKSNGAF